MAIRPYALSYNKLLIISCCSTAKCRFKPYSNTSKRSAIISESPVIKNRLPTGRIYQPQEKLDEGLQPPEVELVEELAKVENILETSELPQPGQTADESSLADFKSSNFLLHLLHLYSNIGIKLLL